jgi:xanthine dehydrogenase YagT iron-sulfur-binding subunit
MLPASRSHLMDKEPEPASRAVSRRSFISSAAASSAAALPPDCGTAKVGLDPPHAAADRGGRVTVSLRINEQLHVLSVDPRTTLLDAIRDEAGLTGTKKGCGHGQCGACTILIDGRRVLSCLMFAMMADGARVTTVEGLSKPGGELHPVQQAFIDHDAFQCGYCTPGQIMSAVGCINEGHANSPADIREYMSGNLCRCAAYPNIVAAVAQASRSGKI